MKSRRRTWGGASSVRGKAEGGCSSTIFAFPADSSIRAESSPARAEGDKHYALYRFGRVLCLRAHDT